MTEKTVAMTGSLAANLHEGSRSEYLAQFVFSAFGTSVPVPHQEDAGLDLYCTIVERIGQRAWPRAHYSVQVKSTMDPWVFGSAESVRWLIEHPLPIFLCVVQKNEARILVYHTSPRFAAWMLKEQPETLVLTPGTKTEAQTVEWSAGNDYDLSAPILNFTIAELLQEGAREEFARVLKFWIEYDVENLFRIQSGIQHLRVPHDYSTNSTKITGWSAYGSRFRAESLKTAEERLAELLGHISTHYYDHKDLVTATIYAIALRQLRPEGYYPFNPHNTFLHGALNQHFGMTRYLYEACDQLLQHVKEELAQHGIPPAPATTSEQSS